MVRIKNLEDSLDFYCNKLGLVQTNTVQSEQGRFTLVFLSAPDDMPHAQAQKTPLLELTYNWPKEDGGVEDYQGGRNFGHLAYEVKNIYETCQKLMASGVTINRPPRDGRMAFIKSPDNISIELLQAGDNLPPQEPWHSMNNTGTW